jgi:hypothetical protein
MKVQTIVYLKFITKMSLNNKKDADIAPPYGRTIVSILHVSEFTIYFYSSGHFGNKKG